MNILVIEDDHLLRRALSHYLLDCGHTVSACANGREALDLIEENRQLDVIIADVMMPVLSGASFVLMLRRYFPGGLPRIVLMSAMRDGEAFVKHLDLNYDQYLQKPVDFEDLGRLVQKWERQKV